MVPNLANTTHVKLFVGQIPRTMGEEELRPTVSQFGTVIELTVLRDRATQMHRGCAFLIYSTKDEAMAAIQGLNNLITLPGAKMPLQVKLADGEAERLQQDQQAKLFVGMVPKTADEDQLRQIFGTYGELDEVVILRHSDSQQSKGCAFVKYRQRACAQAAITALAGQLRMDGSPGPLVVRFADDAKTKQQRLQQNTQQAMMGAGMPGLDLATSQMLMLQLMMAGYGVPGATAGIPGMGAMPAMANPMAAFQQQPPKTSQAEGPDGANLFIYHLPIEYRDDALKLAFSPFGNVLSAKVFIDPKTNESKRFGFVSFDNAMSAQNAIAHMNGMQVGDKRLKVQLKERKGAQPY